VGGTPASARRRLRATLTPAPIAPQWWATALRRGDSKEAKVNALKSLALTIGTLMIGAGLGTASTAEAAAASQPEPTIRQIESFHATLLDVMKKGAELGIEGRYKKLAPQIDAVFDLPAMTRFTVGPAWATMAEADHKSLIAAFRRMTVASYAYNFDSFKGQKFVVDPKVEVRNAERLVKSQVLPEGEKPVNLTYRMRESEGTWRIIDVIYEYVSQVATRRSDFSATVADGGAAALVKKLDEISDKLMRGKEQT
jgi:phospholipid transport system substrate-binding protein